MNEVYTDQEKKANSIQRIVEFVAQQFNLPYGNNVEIKVKLPRYRIIQLSRQMLEQAKLDGVMISQEHELNHDEFCFTKYTLPCGTIEFIDNGE